MTPTPTTTLDLTVPGGWRELSDRQLLHVCRLVADGFGGDELKALCLFRWGGLTVVGRQDSGACLLKKGKVLFEATPLALAELLPHLDWLATPPPYPVRPSRMGRRKAPPADFREVPFETFIICDNLYQGYLRTRDEGLLDQLAATLYGAAMRMSPARRVAVFWWMVSLTGFLSRKFPDFFRPAAEEATDAQIRALTNGDVTKEREVLAIDTWRALAELNAKAREYKELNSKLNSR